MGWVQNVTAMKNSIKLIKKAEVTKVEEVEKQEIIQKLEQKQINQDLHSNLINSQIIQPQQKYPTNITEDSVIETNIYEDPKQAELLSTKLNVENSYILDQNLPELENYKTILKDLQNKKQQYFVSEFPPTPQSLGKGLEQYEWKRLSQIWPDYQIFVKDITETRFGLGKWISPKDIRQGELGDCYFLSTLSSIACRWPDTILKLYLTQEKNSCGLYVVKLCIDGMWKAIILDDFIPVKYGNPAFSRSLCQEAWVLLLEKAWAKSFGSYSNIVSGTSREVMRALTGGPTWTLLMEKEDFKEQFTDCITKRCLMTTGTFAKDEKYQLTGLISGHSYSILKIRKVKHSEKGEINLIKLRNPWGMKEWNGEWSDNCKLWTQEIKTQLRKFDQDDGEDENEDGIFYMSYQDFVNYFCRVSVGYFKTNYIYSTLQVVSKAKKSLYFTVDIIEEGEYYFSGILQSTKHFREKYPNYNYSLMRIILGYKTQLGYQFKEGKQEFDQEVFVGGQLQKGQYIIQVKVFWQQWNEHNFNISSYGQKEVKTRLIQKNEDFIQQMMIDQARQSGELKPFSYGGITLQNYIHKNPKIGIYYHYYKNDGNKIIELTCQLDMAGIKLKKPERGNSYKIIVEPSKDKIVLFLIDSKGGSFKMLRKMNQI